MDQVELKTKITGPFGSPVRGSTTDHGPIDTNEDLCLHEPTCLPGTSSNLPQFRRLRR
ncbi:hypothetical protein AHiyo8_08270 [Arthrobacter sp. Hiyo8]|nr:hypothetical protein AHiyo8_08270 [Arthrobacter sp. Hiyo8]